VKFSLEGDGMQCIFKDVADEGVDGDRSSHRTGGWEGSWVVTTLEVVPVKIALRWAQPVLLTTPDVL